MPLHDWTRVPVGLFHHFHQDWSIEIARALNRGRLPKGLSALVEQRAGPRESDVLAIEQEMRREVRDGGVAAPRDFIDKTIEFLRADVHVLIADLFPPTSRNPDGIHKAIWDEIMEEDFEFPEGKDRILVSYETGAEQCAYIEPIGVGDALPDMPLFLISGVHVMVPLEATYQTAWDASPEALRLAVKTPITPESELE